MTGYPSGPYYHWFQPIVQEGQNVLFTPRTEVSRSEKSGTLRRVNYTEMVPLIEIDLLETAGVATLAAAGTQADIRLTDLDMEEDEFAQWRFFPVDDIEVVVKQPLGKTRWKTKNEIARVDKFIIQTDPHLRSTELFQYEDTHLAMSLINPTEATISKARIRVSGIRYVLDERVYRPRELIEELGNAAYDEIGPGKTREAEAAWRYKQLLNTSRDEGMVLNAMLRDGYVKAVAVASEGLG